MARPLRLRKTVKKANARTAKKLGKKVKLSTIFVLMKYHVLKRDDDKRMSKELKLTTAQVSSLVKSTIPNPSNLPKIPGWKMTKYTVKKPRGHVLIVFYFKPVSAVEPLSRSQEKTFIKSLCSESKSWKSKSGNSLVMSCLRDN
jgi:hypothetical protein